jgi:hypothetical protein
MPPTSRFCGNYIVPAETMEKIDRALKFYATYGSWHYSDREMRAPPRACSAMDRRPQALIDSGKFAGEVYAELVKLYPLEHAAASETQRHVHTCMSCGEAWFCPHQPGDCTAPPKVMPSLILRGPSGPTVFHHDCKAKK